MRIAIVHDWILGLRGGERVLDVLCALYPDATVYTLFHRTGRTTPRIDDMKIVSSPLNRVPRVDRTYRYLLPLFPWAVERFDFGEFDLVLSCSHAVAKGAVVPPPAAHLCYCLTPMRYIWDMYPAYRSAEGNRSAGMGLKLFRRVLQKWDRKSAARVTEFAAISSFVADRIERLYHRDSRILYPPVDTDWFHLPSPGNARQDYYLFVSALVPYKRADLVIDAFNRLKLPLLVAGSGPLEDQLKRQAGPTIRFLGRVSDEELRRLYQEARALVFAAREEFGITPVEAQACGTPVIAFGEGGVAETVVDGRTGVFYHRQETEALAEAVCDFNPETLDPGTIRENALRFSQNCFVAAFTDFVSSSLRR